MHTTQQRRILSCPHSHHECSCCALYSASPGRRGRGPRMPSTPGPSRRRTARRRARAPANRGCSAPTAGSPLSATGPANGTQRQSGRHAAAAIGCQWGSNSWSKQEALARPWPNREARPPGSRRQSVSRKALGEPRTPALQHHNLSACSSCRTGGSCPHHSLTARRRRCGEAAATESRRARGRNLQSTEELRSGHEQFAQFAQECASGPASPFLNSVPLTRRASLSCV